MMGKIKADITENLSRQDHSGCVIQDVCSSIDSEIHTHPPGYWWFVVNSL